MYPDTSFASKFTSLLAPNRSTMSKGKISVIGVGRLGICVALSLDRAGYEVLGVDVFPSYVDAINKKTLRSPEPFVEEFLQASKNFRATTSMDEAIAFSDILMIFCATPNSGGDRFYDHSTLTRILSDINARKVQNKHVVIGCTVLPGYINEVGKFALRDCVNTSLSYNPEFIAQGEIIQTFLNPDMVLIGEGSKDAGDVLEKIYLEMCDNQPRVARMSASSAEICKISLNCFVTTKISYANYIGDIADRTPGANKYDILQAIGADTRVGNKYLRPGYGYGGPCFPRDNRALAQYAESVGIKPLISNATDEYNNLHRKIMVEELLKKNLDVYEFEDVAYKANCPVPIIEESQKLLIARDLIKAGKKVLIRDTADKIRACMEEYGSIFQYEVMPDAPNAKKGGPSATRPFQTKTISVSF
eukprot:tig00020610_g12066.t1